MSQYPQIAVMTPEQIISYMREAVRIELGSMVRETTKRKFVMKEDKAAEYIGVSPATLRTWRGLGRGPAFIRQGRAICYKVEDLDAWIASGRKITVETPGHAHK